MDLTPGPTFGFRTIISDFGMIAQGPLGDEPGDVTLDEDPGNALVTDPSAGTNGDGVLFRVDLTPGPTFGDRTIISDFGNAGQGPLGVSPIGVTLGGSALVIDASAGTSGDGELFRVDLTTGDRVSLSDFGDPGQGPLGNNTVAVVIFNSIVDLAVVKSGFPDPVIVGGSLAYTIFIVNFEGLATGVTLTDILPSDVMFQSATPDQGSCMEASGIVTCEIGTMFSGDIVRVDITVTAPNTAGAILNIAEATSDYPDTNPGDNHTEIITQVVNAPPNTTLSDLVVLKTSPDPVIVDVDFDYTIFVANLGPDVASNVTVTDILPPSVDIVLPLPAGCAEVPAMSGIIECKILSLPVDTVVSFSITVNPNDLGIIFNIAQAALGASPTTNTVQVDPAPSNNTDAITTEVLRVPPKITLSDLVITKAAPAVIIENEQFGYSIEVVNLGPDLAQNVIVKDIIPDDVDFLSFPPACSIIMNTPPVRDELICDLGDMEVGEVRRIDIRTVYTGVVPQLPLSRAVFNLATVDFGRVSRDLLQIDPETSNNTDVAITRAIAQPPNINFVDLFLVKTDSPDPVVVEEELTYNIFVYNFGPKDAVDVTVTDKLPAGVTVVSAPGCAPPSGNVLICSVPNIAANGGLAIIPITVDAPVDTGMILNAAQAFVNPFALLFEFNTIQIDFAPSNNTDSEKTTVVPVPPPLSDLLILKTDTPDPVIEDEFLTYTIFVKNTGPDPAFGVLVSDWLPKEGLDLDTVEFIFSPNVAFCIQDPDALPPPLDEPFRVECLIPSLGVEESATINVKVKTLPLPDGLEFLNIFNLAKVESLGDERNQASADPNPLNNVVVESTLIGEFVPIADLLIIKSDSPDPVTVDRTLTYVLFVSNAGPDPATGVTIIDTLPASVDFVSAVANQGNCGAPAGNVLTCNLGDLAVGEFTQVTVIVTPTVTGTILNVAQVSGNEHDPKSSNNISPQTTTVKPAPAIPPDNPGEPQGNDLFVLKFVSPNPAEVGDEITFTIIVGNNGQFGSGVTLVDTLPDGLTFVSASSSTGEQCNEAGGKVTCDLGSVPPLGQGEIVTVEIIVRADQTGTFPNVALLEGDPTDPNTTNNVAIVAINVVSGSGDESQNPNPDPGADDPGDGGDSNNSGCSVAAGAIKPGSSAFNFAVLLLPLLVFGVRSIKRKK